MRTAVALTVPVLLLAACEGGETRTHRPVYELTPPGPPSTQGPQMAALAQGRLVGALADGKVRSWLQGDDGSRTVVAWPQTFRARLDPLELLDERGRIVAHGGELVSVGGGFRPGERKVFLASSVSSRAIP